MTPAELRKLEEFEMSMIDGIASFIGIDETRVNLNDLISDWRPGKIVRCIGDPATAIRSFYESDTSHMLGCVAGWISEE